MTPSRIGTQDVPLVLLDIDGVINDLGHLQGQPRPWETWIIQAGRFRIHIPEYMPQLIQSLAAGTEIHWCTTWREAANGVIADTLCVGPFPVIDDGSDSMLPEWKARAARPVVTAALVADRRVIWIEDFYGVLPTAELPAGVEYVDTGEVAGGAVLTPELVPPGLVDG